MRIVSRLGSDSSLSSYDHSLPMTNEIYKEVKMLATPHSDRQQRTETGYCRAKRARPTRTSIA